MAAPAQLLIGYDGSASAQAAIRVAGRLLPGARARVVAVHASRASFDRVVLTGVVPTPQASKGADELAHEALEEARSAAEEGARLAAGSGLEASAASVEEDRHAWDALLREADADDADLVVSGTRGRGAFARALLGTTATGLLHNARRPLLVVPEGEGGGDGPVVLAYDGSGGAREAIAVTARLLGRRPAVVVHAWGSPAQHSLLGGTLSASGLGRARQTARDLEAMLAAAAAATAEEGAALARGAGLAATGEAIESSVGSWRTLSAAAAQRSAALLVVGARGTGRAASALIGSVSAGLVHNVELPTLVVPGDAPA